MLDIIFAASVGSFLFIVAFTAFAFIFWICMKLRKGCCCCFHESVSVSITAIFKRTMCCFTSFFQDDIEQPSGNPTTQTHSNPATAAVIKELTASIVETRPSIHAHIPDLDEVESAVTHHNNGLSTFRTSTPNNRTNCNKIYPMITVSNVNDVNENNFVGKEKNVLRISRNRIADTEVETPTGLYAKHIVPKNDNGSKITVEDALRLSRLRDFDV